MGEVNGNLCYSYSMTLCGIKLSSPALLWMCIIVTSELFSHTSAATEAPAIDPGTKCLKDESLGDIYDSNVYYCADMAKPECCQVDDRFDCCEDKSGHTFKQQAILWGSVFGVVSLVAIIWVCYRKDTYMCEGETLSKRMKRCCGCEKKVNPNDEKVELSDLSDGSEKLKWHEEETGTTNIDGYYDNNIPVTSRAITPVVAGQNMYTDGMDSDSGRGSTTSEHGAAGGHHSRGGSGVASGGGAVAYPPDLEHYAGPGNSSNPTDLENDNNPHAGNSTETAPKKKKKKKNKKKKQPLNDVVEEDIDI